MILHRALLEQARHLLGRESRRPRQASSRRAISAAYYAVFHPFTREASRIFVNDPDMIGMIARAYDHGAMAKVSRSFTASELPRKLRPLFATFANNPGRLAVFNDLKSIAQRFLDLQSARHEADYNLRMKYTRREATDFVNLAEAVFSDWERIRKDDLARIYPSCFLVFDEWNKDR